MPTKIIADAGLLVAFLDASDRWHQWAVRQFKRFSLFETCEAALSEACARLCYAGLDQVELVRMTHEGAVELTFDAGPNLGRILKLMDKYSDQPMDFADACLVVMSEEQKDVLLITTDTDFATYRRNGRDVIPLALARD